jgi:hypothetical protein
MTVNLPLNQAFEKMVLFSGLSLLRTKAASNYASIIMPLLEGF